MGFVYHSRKSYYLQSGHLGIWKSGYLAIRISGYPEIRQARQALSSLTSMSSKLAMLHVPVGETTIMNEQAQQCLRLTIMATGSSEKRHWPRKKNKRKVSPRAWTCQRCMTNWLPEPMLVTMLLQASLHAKLLHIRIGFYLDIRKARNGVGTKTLIGT